MAQKNKAVVVGKGITGRVVIEALERDTDWDIVAIARSEAAFGDRASFVATDLLDPERAKHDLSGLDDVTHYFYCGLAGGVEAENVTDNLSLLRNSLDPIEAASPGLKRVADPTQCHAVAIDGRAPKYDGGIVTRLDCVPFSMVVNKQRHRFYDEGEDIWPKRYAIWGRLVAAQTDQVAFSVIDAKARGLFMPSVFSPVVADTVEELAKKLGLDPSTLVATVAEFNAACREGEFRSTELDGLSTDGLAPEKTNWARPIDTPPYAAYMLRTGVTFTYLGLKVSETGQVLRPDGPFKNIWAAGEIMAGNILVQGYLAGIGMTIGTVFGRIAGREAARHV